VSRGLSFKHAVWQSADADIATLVSTTRKSLPCLELTLWDDATPVSLVTIRPRYTSS